MLLFVPDVTILPQKIMKTSNVYFNLPLGIFSGLVVGSFLFCIPYLLGILKSSSTEFISRNFGQIYHEAVEANPLVEKKQFFIQLDQNNYLINGTLKDNSKLTAHINTSLSINSVDDGITFSTELKPITKSILNGYTGCLKLTVKKEYESTDHLPNTKNKDIIYEKIINEVVSDYEKVNCKGLRNEQNY
jgi:hypothetical protein